MKRKINRILKRGDTGEDVALLQNMLRDLNYNISIDGIFGRGTQQAVRTFQLANGLVVDGIVGYNTNSELNSTLVREQGLFANDERLVRSKDDERLGQFIAEEAKGFIGQEEIAGNEGFKTPWFHDLMTKVGFVRSHPWCAYFTELAWKTGYNSYLRSDDLSAFKDDVDELLTRLFSGSVMKTYNNFKREGEINRFTVSNTPSVGSLIVFQSRTNKAFGHIGIVIEVNEEEQTVTTVEGNTNDGGGREGYIVAIKTRSVLTNPYSRLQLLGFIHPTVKIIKD